MEGKFLTKGAVNNKIPLNYKWNEDDWQIEINADETDENGWQYATDFSSVRWAPKRTLLYKVRRRKWTRTRVKIQDNELVRTMDLKRRTVSPEHDVRGDITRSESRSTVTAKNDDGGGGDFDGTLIVSYTNQFTLAWSTHGVIESSGYQCSVWKPNIGDNEYCLGYLLSAEKSYPTNSFLIIIKGDGSDADAFCRPTGLNLAWSTRFKDASTAMYGSFYKPRAPMGYVALGDVALVHRKEQTVTVEDFPKLVCVKQEYVDKYEELSTVHSMRVKSLIQPHTLIWNTRKLNVSPNLQLWTQPPFSSEVATPLYVFSCKEVDSKPENVYPRLNLHFVLQDDPDNITVFAEWMTKKGKGVGSKSHKRFFILTSEKKLYYYETEECRNLKGVVDLTQMEGDSRTQYKNTEKFELQTPGRKWEFTCDSSQVSGDWVNKINATCRDPKKVVNKIIARQIQGQPMDEDDDDFKGTSAADEEQSYERNLFDAPLKDQVSRLLSRNVSIIRAILSDRHDTVFASKLDHAFDDDVVGDKKHKTKTKRSGTQFKISSLVPNLSAMSHLSSDSSATTENIEDSMDELAVFTLSKNNPGSKSVLAVRNEVKQQCKESIYKYLDDAWKAIRLLLKYFTQQRQQDKRLPKEVEIIQSQISTLQQRSVQYILDRIRAYVEQQTQAHFKSLKKQSVAMAIADPHQIVEMCDACYVVESFTEGRETVIADITSNLLEEIRENFKPDTEYAGCKFVSHRFDDYELQIQKYEEIYAFFVPAKWIVPVTFSLQFCQLTGEQLNEHLTKNPENSVDILQAKQICIEYEKKLTQDAEIVVSKPNTELTKEEIRRNIPQYDGMISLILEQHLNSYISVEGSKAKECVESAKNETFSVLSEDGSLTEMYEGGSAASSTQKHKSCEMLLVAIRHGFRKCIQISCGDQLVQLLKAHQEYLSEYHDILYELAREALETNGALLITPKTRQIEVSNSENKLTQKYLWFDGYYSSSRKIAGTRTKTVNQDGVIQQVLTFLVLVFNSALYCKESVLNLGRAAHQSIEPKALKKRINFQPLHSQFAALQNTISERLSHCIVCRMVQHLHGTYATLEFNAMSERDYITLEKCRYLVESSWSSLPIQLLYIMPLVHYKLMLKRCVYLLAEYLFESTLTLAHVSTTKIAHLLRDNYVHIKNALILHLANESQHLAAEISEACQIVFEPCDCLYELLCTSTTPLLAIENDGDDEDGDGARKTTMTKSIYSSIFGSGAAGGGSGDELAPVFYQRYTPFEMKCVEFYHTRNVVLCFDTLLLQLIEHQIKLNRLYNISSVKPYFFAAFDFAQYSKPQTEQKRRLKQLLIRRVMQCKEMESEQQHKIEMLCANKSYHDMKQEQQESIRNAWTKRTEWEQQQQQQQQHNNSREDDDVGGGDNSSTTTETTRNSISIAQSTTEEPHALDDDAAVSVSSDRVARNNARPPSMSQAIMNTTTTTTGQDDIIVMTQSVPVEQVDNKLVVIPDPDADFEIHYDDAMATNLLRRTVTTSNKAASASISTTIKIAPPAHKPPPPKMTAPKLPPGKAPPIPKLPPPSIPK